MGEVTADVLRWWAAARDVTLPGHEGGLEDVQGGCEQVLLVGLRPRGRGGEPRQALDGPDSGILRGLHSRADGRGDCRCGGRVDAVGRARIAPGDGSDNHESHYGHLGPHAKTEALAERGGEFSFMQLPLLPETWRGAACVRRVCGSSSGGTGRARNQARVVHAVHALDPQEIRSIHTLGPSLELGLALDYRSGFAMRRHPFQQRGRSEPRWYLRV